ncbi:MAG TPA: phosphatase PAP2 family protein [Chthoniobacterales bacterium]|nr:phosphatase PAP2 family protein [Chthoniobacterales bacterium]
MRVVPQHARWRWERHVRFLQARLSPQGYMGLHLTVGVAVILLSGWCFTQLAGEIAEGDLARLDEGAVAFVQSYANPAVTQAARIVSSFGSVAFLTVASFVAAAVFLWKRWFDAILGLALTMLGGSLLNVLLKQLFQRQRPVFETPLVNLSTFAFPSGHTMGATLFYMFIAAVVAYAMKSRRIRVLAFGSALVLVAMIGMTRIYLGAHFVTDVVGAIVAGVAWLAFCWTAVETLRKWRKGERKRQLARS